MIKKKLSASHLIGCADRVNRTIITLCVFCGAGTGVSAHFICRRCKNISKENLINEEIRDKELRVIDSDGTQLGIISLEDALALANERKLDLVNISPNANPPVCKILDYGKYRYELQKREKEAKKKQKVTSVKEIRLSTFIEAHDIQVKANTAVKFLKDGDRVKVSLRFKGREKDYANKGLQVMNQFAESVSSVGTIEKKPEFEGRSLIMIVAPKTDK
ncbi:translation initiation factor IF-3 [Aminipila sp.]|uniref:translation initiation factor IF-3 n=1 Tax=Aminipila sp. TaxID=2060095 RepID=UPI003FA450EB